MGYIIKNKKYSIYKSIGSEGFPQYHVDVKKRRLFPKSTFWRFPQIFNDPEEARDYAEQKVKFIQIKKKGIKIIEK